MTTPFFRLLSLGAVVAAGVCGCRTIFLPEPPPRADYEIVGCGSIALKDVPDGLSGVTYVSNSLYLAVSDVAGAWVMLKPFHDERGNVRKCVSRGSGMFPGNRNVEGVAYDRALGAFWICDENDTSIRGFRDRLYLGEVEVPAVLKSCEPNRSLESLAISPDGLSMWTANEDTLTADGAFASQRAGGVVRLTRFSRLAPGEPWTLSGMWAYPTEKVDGKPYRNVAQSGVSAICVAPDGSPLVLEREVSRPSLVPRFRVRIYQVDLSMAADISRDAALDGMFIGTARKRLLFDETTGTANYEGMAIGPADSNGACPLVLVADNGSGCASRLAVLRLAPRR